MEKDRMPTHWGKYKEWVLGIWWKFLSRVGSQNWSDTGYVLEH
jgi:hypothetical protein